MRKITDTTELQAELRQLLAYSKSERPSRVRIASQLNALSARLRGKIAAAAPSTVDERVQKLSPSDRKQYDKYLADGDEDMAKRFLRRHVPERTQTEHDAYERYQKMDALVKDAMERSMLGKNKWRDGVPQHIPLYAKYLREGVAKAFPSVKMERAVKAVLDNDKLVTRLDVSEYLHDQLERALAKKRA